jgi:Lysylphosphatidylglycerol synthase TM region
MPLLAFLVSASVLVWLVTNPMFGAVLDLLHTRRLGPLLLALALFPVLQWLRAWRFSLLLRRSPEPPGWPDFKLAAQLSFLNLVLPFKLGDFSFPLLARRTVGADLLGATVAIVWCRVNDLCVVVAILALCGACLITPAEHPWFWWASATVGLISLLLPLTLAPLMSLLRAWPRLGRVLGSLPDHASAQHGRRGFHLALTVAIWSTHSLIGYLAVSAIAADLSLVAAAFAGAASNLAFALPVTGVAGLGPPQAAWTAALHLTGATWEISIASALLVYGCLLVGVILTAAPTLLWAPNPARRFGWRSSPHRSRPDVAAI